MRITFCGGAREVTGSCFRFETEAARFLVDCGMFQGGRSVEARNRGAFDFDPRLIDFVLLTHAHIGRSATRTLHSAPLQVELRQAPQCP